MIEVRRNTDGCILDLNVGDVVAVLHNKNGESKAYIDEVKSITEDGKYMVGDVCFEDNGHGSYLNEETNEVWILYEATPSFIAQYEKNVNKPVVTPEKPTNNFYESLTAAKNTAEHHKTKEEGTPKKAQRSSKKQ